MRNKVPGQREMRRNNTLDDRLNEELRVNELRIGDRAPDTSARQIVPLFALPAAHGSQGRPAAEDNAA